MDVMGALKGYVVGILVGAALLGSILGSCGVYERRQAGHADGYRAGQIDAANGVMKYELVKQDDGTTSWELRDD